MFVTLAQFMTIVNLERNALYFLNYKLVNHTFTVACKIFVCARGQ